MQNSAKLLDILTGTWKLTKLNRNYYCSKNKVAFPRRVVINEDKECKHAHKCNSFIGFVFFQTVMNVTFINKNLEFVSYFIKLIKQQ